MNSDSVLGWQPSMTGARPGIILLLLVFVYVVPLNGRAETAPGIELLRGFLESVQTMSAGFKQELFDASQQSIEVAGGTVKFMRPGRFYWSYRQPYERFLVADGERIWMHDPDLDQVTVRDLKTGLGNTPAALLTGNIAVLDNFKVVETTFADHILWLQLLPVKRDGDFERIGLGFSGLRLVQFELKDRLGQTTRVEFNDIELNPTLDTDEFRFKIPEGADVIDESTI